MSADDLTVQYVLGELPPDEARRFEARVAADATLAEEVRRLRAALGLLPYAKLEEPPPDLRSRVMAAAEARIREKATRTEATAPVATPVAPPIASEPRRAPVVPIVRPARRVVWSQFAAAIAAMLVLAIGIDNLRVRRELAMQQDVAHLLLEPNVVRAFTLRGGGGFGTVALDMDAKRGAVVLKGMPALPADHTYRLWAEVGDKSVPCGDFGVAADGTVHVQFRVPVEQYTAPLGKLFVTVEPNGEGATPTGRRVMQSV